MTDTTSHTFAIGDRFTYTGDPKIDEVDYAIDTGATGAVTRFDAHWLGVTFDSTKNGALRSGWFVRPANLTPLVEPPTWKAGDRFIYTGDPTLDFLESSILRGATGTLVKFDDYPDRWIVDFDSGTTYIGGIFVRCGVLYVSTSRITPLPEPEPETVVYQYPTDVAAERDAARAELVAFKAKVFRVARAYATAHGWCDTVSEALQDLGIVQEVTSYVRAHIDVDFEVKHTGLRPDDDEVRAAAEALFPGAAVSIDEWGIL